MYNYYLILSKNKRIISFFQVYTSKICPLKIPLPLFSLNCGDFLDDLRHGPVEENQVFYIPQNQGIPSIQLGPFSDSIFECYRMVILHLHDILYDSGILPWHRGLCSIHQIF